MDGPITHYEKRLQRKHRYLVLGYHHHLAGQWLTKVLEDETFEGYVHDCERGTTKNLASFL
jgi:hypothetical protein